MRVEGGGRGWLSESQMDYQLIRIKKKKRLQGWWWWRRRREEEEERGER